MGPNLDICFFREILQVDKLESADFKFDKSFLKFLPENPKQGTFDSKFKHYYFFREILQIDKFEGADFKYSISFFKF